MGNLSFNNEENTADDTAVNYEPIFALDIGTRSIIGIVGIPEGEFLKVIGVEVAEHKKRTMIDGQIEDIEETAKTAEIVKKRLEEKLGLSLNTVFVAAAGRALKTQRSTYETALDPCQAIQNNKIVELEMCAIQQAYESVVSDNDDTSVSLYCVGHSVVKYYLDDYPISTLLNHKGKKAKVEIIATFLPNQVVESLYAAMESIKLNVSNITLEPIAAMNAIIPNELRMLNLALVDIGAGTSDIAISNGGSVIAYTMATIAGDELTESLMQECLIDFQTAERVKLEISKGIENIEYKNILGFSNSVTAKELLEKIQPAVNDLCSEICFRIMEVNGKAPAAVFLVGGGSQVPGMCSKVANNLDIEENKVVIGGNNFIKKTVSCEQNISGPEYATPVGIAITALGSIERGSFKVTVNDKQIRLFKTNAVTVMDILLMCGYKHNQIIGRSGKSVTFELNQMKKVIRGGYPTAAVITVNGLPASISTPVQPGDNITVETSVAGADASPVLHEVADRWSEYKVSLNGVRVKAGTKALINGAIAEKNKRINNMDIVEIYEVTSLSDLCREEKIDMENYVFTVNGNEKSASYKLSSGDVISYYEPPNQAEENIQNFDDGKNKETEIPKQNNASLNNESSLEEKPNQKLIQIKLNNKKIELNPKQDNTPYLFLDMLNFVDIDPTKPEGNIILQINGKSASYLDVVAEGDAIDIYWEKA